MSKMNENDARILEFKELIAKKKESITAKNVRVASKTTCIMTIDNVNYNLNAMDLNDLTQLMIKLNMYNMSADNLQVDHIVLKGYVTDIWIEDIKNKINSLSIKQEEKELKQLEARLDDMLSEDRKTTLALDEIAALLK